jgi:hypothetical protein
MATRTVTSLVDDLDGSVAEENLSFGLDRVEYEIDLSAGHAQALREVFAPYLAAARRVGGRRSPRGTQPARPARSNGQGGPARSRSTNAEIRAWAAEHGVALAERGRIPGRVIEAFEAGDASRLPSSGGSSAATRAPAEEERIAPATTVEAPAPAPADDEPRGRDGLTASEREAVRAWAVDQGIEVKTRGQLKKDLVANYRAWQNRQ